MNRLTSGRNKEYCGGLILILVGAATALQSQAYRIGTMSHMGPGFFPAALGIILAFCGATLIVTTYLQRDAGAAPKPALPAEWRGWGCICAGVVAFAVLAEFAGLIPACFACVFITALGDRDNSVRDAGILATGITVAAVGVFWWGLGVLLPLIKWDMF